MRDSVQEERDGGPILQTSSVLVPSLSGEGDKTKVGYKITGTEGREGRSRERGWAKKLAPGCEDFSGKSKNRTEFHQTWEPPFSPPLYLCALIHQADNEGDARRSLRSRSLDASKGNNLYVSLVYSHRRAVYRVIHLVGEDNII